VGLIGDQRSYLTGQLLAIVALFMACIATQSRAAEFSDYLSFTDRGDGASRYNSVLLFGGWMSTTNLGSTLFFNRATFFSLSPYQPYYDNNIIGGAYQRDVFRLGGLVIAAEVGIADRFGHYTECCAPVEKTIHSSGIVDSFETWIGPAFRYEAIVLFNTVRFVPGITAGFSVVTNSIGAEAGNVAYANGNATFLGYLGFEADFSLVSAPAWEFVIEEHHRSGAGELLGRLHEGYNANVIGLRYRF
jgi:hypothetical protein